MGAGSMKTPRATGIVVSGVREFWSRMVSSSDGALSAH